MKQPKLSDLKVDVAGTKDLRQSLKKAKKVKITVNIDDDILAGLRKMADQTGAPYQSLLNKLLRAALSGQADEESRLDRLEREISRLKKKISA
jgi:predicted DNA binding CopG/RHH family protein